jgi:hypothetical protein
MDGPSVHAKADLVVNGDVNVADAYGALTSLTARLANEVSRFRSPPPTPFPHVVTAGGGLATTLAMVGRCPVPVRSVATGASCTTGSAPAGGRGRAPCRGIEHGDVRRAATRECDRALQRP